jgi:hypothetical protein
MKQYQYTLLKQDGTKKGLWISSKKTFQDFYKILNCSLIEIIHPDYYQGKGYGRCTMYGDEEGRFNSDNKRNPHFNVLALDYDVVGDIIMEKVYHEKS